MGKNRILVVEDDAAIRELLAMNLEAAEYQVILAEDGLEASAYLRENERASADLALVDIMLPGIDGFELMGIFQKYRIPVIYLTAKGDLDSKVCGLRMGAEDYMVKPFELLELLVRMEKMLERTGKMQQVLTFHDLSVDMVRHQVTEKGKRVELKPTEFALLTVFLKNKNRILTRDQLLDLVWGSDFVGESRTVDVHVAKLRKKLVTAQAIHTIPKAGYLLEADDET